VSIDIILMLIFLVLRNELISISSHPDIADIQLSNFEFYLIKVSRFDILYSENQKTVK